MGKGRFRVSWLAAAVVGLVCVGIGVVEKRSMKNFAAHDAGRVYRSAWLTESETKSVVERFHIKTVVNLCLPEEDPSRLAAERRALAGTGARGVLIPFPRNDTSNVDHPGIAAFEQLLADEANYPLLVHCYHGRERTAKALAMYDLRRRGMSAEESLAKMQSFAGRGQTGPVVEFSRNYEAHLRKSQPNATANRTAPAEPPRR